MVNILHGFRRQAPLALFAALTAVTGCSVPSGHNQAGVQAFSMGHYDVALSRFQLAADSDPLNADAIYNMARVHHELGTKRNSASDIERAEGCYNQCLDVSPNHVAAHRGLAVLLAETGREDAAFRLMKNWALASPQSADARVELARLYEEFGDDDTAMLQLSQANAIDGYNERIKNAMAEQRLKEGDLQQALDNYRQSLAINSMQPTVVARVAQLQQATSTSVGSMSPNGTRTVTPTIGGGRY